MQLSWSYPKGPFAGAWGTPTSNHNFCEEDYLVSSYIAEFVNTLTNLTYVLYGVQGLRRIKSKAGGSLCSPLTSPYWGLVGVGLLSGWYHATLKYHSQMGDDLSMFLAVGTMLHQLLCFQATPTQQRMYTLYILGTVIPISVYHCWMDEIIAHEITFAIMVFLVARQIHFLTKKQIVDKKHRKRIHSMATFGVGSGLFGYFLWNIDFHFCERVTTFKHYIGLPWGVIFELHGWWHILTGMGAYVGMAIVEYLVTMEEGKTGRIEEGFVWPVRAVLRDLDGVHGEQQKTR